MLRGFGGLLPVREPLTLVPGTDRFGNSGGVEGVRTDQVLDETVDVAVLEQQGGIERGPDHVLQPLADAQQIRGFESEVVEPAVGGYRVRVSTAERSRDELAQQPHKPCRDGFLGRSGVSGGSDLRRPARGIPGSHFGRDRVRLGQQPGQLFGVPNTLAHQSLELGGRIPGNVVQRVAVAQHLARPGKGFRRGRVHQNGVLGKRRRTEALQENRHERILPGNIRLAETGDGGSVHDRGMQQETTAVGDSRRTGTQLHQRGTVTLVTWTGAPHRRTVPDLLTPCPAVEVIHRTGVPGAPLERLHVQRSRRRTIREAEFGPRVLVPRAVQRPGDTPAAVRRDPVRAVGRRVDRHPYLAVVALRGDDGFGEQHPAEDDARRVVSLGPQHTQKQIEKSDTGHDRDPVHPMVAHDEVAVQQGDATFDRWIRCAHDEDLL
ncbi:hypothetical protein GCM10027444_33900 [Actinopolyspora lacussalsi]